MNEKAYTRVYRKILSFADYQPRSRFEIEIRLNRYIYKEKLSLEESFEIKQKILDELEKLEFVDDRKVAKEYVQNALTVSRPRSRRKVYTDLMKKGIPRNVLEEEIAGFSDEDELRHVLTELNKKFGSVSGPINYATRKKISDYLYRRGYSTDIVSKALDQSFKP